MTVPSGARVSPSSSHAFMVLPGGTGRFAGLATRRQQGAPCRPPWLGGGAAHVLGAGPFRSLSDIELDAVAFAQILEPLTVDGALVEEVLLPRVVLDESESLIDSQRTNFSCHGSLPVRSSRHRHRWAETAVVARSRSCSWPNNACECARRQNRTCR